MKRKKFERLGKLRMSETIANVIFEAPGYYARVLADEMGLQGEKRYLFIARVEQANTIQKMLVLIGAITVAVTPYVMVKALTR